MQAEACAWLGHWWWEVRQDGERAMNCFSRALELNPDDTVTSESPPCCSLRTMWLSLALVYCCLVTWSPSGVVAKLCQAAAVFREPDSTQYLAVGNMSGHHPVSIVVRQAERLLGHVSIAS